MAKPPEKEESKFDKLKQFFGVAKSSSNKLPVGGASSRTPVKEYVLGSQLLQDISRPNPVKYRLKAITQLSDVVLSKRLEENGAEVLWECTRDILKTQTLAEERQVMFRFLQNLIKGQYDNLEMTRVIFFRALKEEISLPEDMPYRFELFQALTSNGKDLDFFEESAGDFLLDLMKSLMGTKKMFDFLQFSASVVKNNNLREATLAAIVLNACTIATTGDAPDCDVEMCLHVLDTTVTHCSLPYETLPQFVTCHCRIVNRPDFVHPSFAVMRKLLDSRLGHSAIYVMCHILQDKQNATVAGAELMRGAIYFIGTSLWSAKRVPSLNHHPSAVLPSFHQALLSISSSIVALEIVLTVHRLVTKYGNEQDALTWDLILDLIVDIIRYTQSDLTCPSEIVKNVHDLLTAIETCYERGEFFGSADRLFVIVEACASQRPESSLLSLITYRVRHLTPVQPDWINSLKDLMDKYFVHGTMSVVRIKIVELLSGLISSTSCLYRDELIENVVLPHVTNIDIDVDVNVRLKVVQLIIDLAETCHSDQFYSLLDVIKKVLSSGSVMVKTSSDDKVQTCSKDVETAVMGLVHIFTKKLFGLPANHTLAVLKAIVEHADRLLATSAHPVLATQTTSIRTDSRNIKKMLIECLMCLRADTTHHIGLLIEGADMQYSPCVRCQPREVSHHRGSISAAVTCTEGAVVLPYEDVFHVIRLYLEKEADWTVLQLILEKLPHLLQNKTLISSAFPGDVEKICVRLCKLSNERNFHESFINAPSSFTKSDFVMFVYPVLTCLVSFHFLLDKTRQAELVQTLEGGLVSKYGRGCIRALTVCAYEMRSTVMRQLPSILHKLSQIQSTVSMAIPVIELLSSLIHLPELYSNFVEEQYMSVFAIALPYTNPFKYNHYTVSLAHHVIAMWFIKCRAAFRRQFVGYIKKSLKVCVLRQIEEQEKQRQREALKAASSVNQDSADRSRAQSLNEEALRKKANRPSRQPGPSVTVVIDEPSHTTTTTSSIAAVPDHNVASAFHKELLDTCIDMLSRYAYIVSSNVPKRSPVAKFLLAGGQSQSWLLGSSILTVTTSGGARVSRSGLCEKCLSIARAASGQQGQSNDDASAAIRRRHKSEAVRATRYDEIAPLTMKPLLLTQDDIHLHRRSAPSGRSVEQVEHSAGEGPLGLDARKKAVDDVLMGLKVQPSDRSVFTPHVCNCWCTQWAELLIRRPTGNFSWMMRLQNEQDLMSMFPDFMLTDISNLFAPVQIDEDSDAVSDNNEPVISDTVDVAQHGREALAESESSPEVHRIHSSPTMGHSSVEGPASQNDSEMNSAHPTIQRSISVSGADTGARHSKSGQGEDVRSVSFSETAVDVVRRDSRHRSGTLSSVSEETDLLPLGQRDHTTSKAARLSLSSTTTQGGINPGFVFLQIFQHQCFRNKSDPDDGLIPMPNTEATEQSISHLDKISPYETHKLGVIYIKPGQTKNEAAILSNMHGSPRYMDFIQKLGDVLRLSECDPISTYVGGLDHRADGPFVYVWHAEFMQVVFHITTLMPCAAEDPQCTGKKLHIGNNYVTIVYNDSGEDYRMGTIKSQFNFVNIMIQPLDQGTNCVTVQTKPEIEDMIGHTDTKIISDANLPFIVRQMAVHANLASMISARQKIQPMNPYASNWLERLRWIRTVRQRLTNERAKSEPLELRSVAAMLKPSACEDFSDFAK